MIPTADRQKATVKVRISFTEPDHVRLYDPANDPRILPDMGVKVTFLENEVKPGSKEDKNPASWLWCRKSAIRQDNSSKYVFVVKGDTHRAPGGYPR